MTRLNTARGSAALALGIALIAASVVGWLFAFFGCLASPATLRSA
jgi:hypothetical protein